MVAKAADMVGVTSAIGSGVALSAFLLGASAGNAFHPNGWTDIALPAGLGLAAIASASLILEAVLRRR